jgi:hypothetical protein
MESLFDLAPHSLAARIHPFFSRPKYKILYLALATHLYSQTALTTIRGGSKIFSKNVSLSHR